MTDFLRSPIHWWLMAGALVLVISILVGYDYYSELKIKRLIEEIRTSDPEVAHRSAIELGEMGSSIVPYLTDVIKDMDSQRRGYAAEALSRASSSVQALLEIFNDDSKDNSTEMRIAAAEVLGKMGETAKDAVPDLIKAINNYDDSVRKTVRVALGKIKDERAVQPFMDLLKQQKGEGDEKIVIEEALADIGPKAIPALMATLRNGNPKLRESSARTIGRMKENAKDAVSDLITILKREEMDENVIQAIKLALGESKDESAIQPLIDTFNIKDEASQKALGKIGKPAVLPLMRILEDKSRSSRLMYPFVVSALGEIGPEAKPAVPVLITLMNDPSGDVRDNTIVALGKIRDAEAVAPLLERLKKQTVSLLDFPFYARSHQKELIIEALGEIGPPARDAVEILFDDIWNDDYHEKAVAALSKISPGSSSKINAEVQRYNKLENTVSSMKVDVESSESTVPGSEKIVFTFSWKLKNPIDDVNYCSKIRIDKGGNAFDQGEIEDKFPLKQNETEITKQMDAKRYSRTTFNWGVIITVCRDPGATCNNNGLCIGRLFKKNQDYP